MRHRFITIAVVAIFGFASESHGDTRDLQQLTELLVGDYYSAADGGVRAGRPIYMRIRTIAAPVASTVALYAEMRHDGVAGELYRQRVYLFESVPTAPLAMQALVFDDQLQAMGLIDDPDLWVRSGWTTRLALVEGCETHWVREQDGFMGRVDPETCVNTGKRGDRRRIESKTLITPEYIGQLEKGYDIDGRVLFGNETDELYVWPRVK